MSNQRKSAGTAADSEPQPIVNSSADIEANPLLGTVRQIKFRGLTIGGYWAFGLLAQDLKGQYYISNRKGVPFAFQVRPETVGQFVGITDESGFEIYEGDIIDYGYSAKPVVYSINSFGVVNQHPDGISFGSYQINTGKVVGNVHQNPEKISR